MKCLQTVIAVALLCVIVVVAYRLALSKVERDIYRDRLASLSGDYEMLRSRYNQAVAKTAVTELIVKDGRLSLAIRTVEGVNRVMETPFNPAREIYCDYVLLDGRLWIRRVYDAHTPPRDGLVIDNDLERLDWNDPAARYGKAVYRSLGEGRWIVTVTGDGSLGLAKTDAKADAILSGPPPVCDYEQLEKQIGDTLDDVSVGDVLKRIVTSNNQSLPSLFPDSRP